MKRVYVWGVRSIAVLALGMALSFVHQGTAFAATKTWTGTAGDHQFNTAGNWSPSGAPTNGDDLVFPTGVSDKAPVNNVSSLSVGTVTFSGDGYNLTGNAMTLTGGVVSAVGDYSGNTVANNLTISGTQTWNLDTNNYVTLSGVISGSGSFTKSGTGSLSLDGSNSSYSGNITVNNGELQISKADSLGTAAGSTTIASGAALRACFTNDLTIAEPLTTSGNGSGDGALLVAGCGGGGDITKTLTLTGAVTLSGDTTVGGANKNTLKLTGALSGAHTLTMASGQDAQLVIASSNSSSTPNGSFTSPMRVTTVDAGDKQPGLAVYVSSNNTYVINGERGDVTVVGNGILKGTGKVGQVFTGTQAQIAPGLSPGCLQTGSLTLSGAYVAEIGGADACSGYDQLIVAGTIDLTGSNLQASFFGDFKPSATGQQYTIINNDGSDAVVGTFNGFAEGATFELSGVVLRVSYVGGDGNDVVLTAVSVPSVPNTGGALYSANPVLVSGLGLMAAAGLGRVARKTVFHRKK